VHVPYKGGGPAMIDMIGGVVQLYLTILSKCYPGEGRQSAHARQSRAPSALRSYRTCRPLGKRLPGYESTLWYGVTAVPGHRSGHQTKLNEAVRQTQQLPDVKARLATMGADTCVLHARRIRRVDQARSGTVGTGCARSRNHAELADRLHRYLKAGGNWLGRCALDV